MQRPVLPRTLILDYYDSYTNNLLTLFTKLYSDAEVLEKVVVVKADKYSWPEFQQNVLPNIDCVILSPGPGRPDTPSDIGFALDLLRSHPLPILGVCLGHQAIAVAFGAKIINTPSITHGHVVPISPVSPTKGLFASPYWQTDGESEKEQVFEVVVYNSLTADPDTIPDELEVTAWSVPSPTRPSTVQGLRHKKYPIWGVQYHPESISSTRGADLLQAFLDEVNAYHSSPASFPPLPADIISACAYRVAASSRPLSRSRTSSILPTPPRTPSSSRPASRLGYSRSTDLGRQLKTQHVFESLVNWSRKGKEKAIGEIWLDGQTPTRPTTSTLATPSFLITYCLATRRVTLHRGGLTPSTLSLPEYTTFWDWFSEAHQSLTTLPTSTSSHRSGSSNGFKGGWVGYFGYEMKEESLQGYRRRTREDGESKAVDACWAWVDRFTERTTNGEWIIRGMLDAQNEDDDVEAEDHFTFGVTREGWSEYVEQVQCILGGSARSDNAPTVPSQSFPTFRPTATGDNYRSKIDACREAIRQGESYELTLTTRFSASMTGPPHGGDAESLDPYALYLRLRSFNPAYYSTYLHFPSLVTPRGNGLTVLSSSPERFLKIDSGRRVEMMPIKGTRARIKPGQCRRADARIGEELRTDQKERAENLMIVDLIRSDLLSCCTPSTVTVPKLIALESYGVHNLVTTVQGILAENVSSVEAVRRCFPPGSMTGAPKLRSVQLLDDFEDRQRRGIYSGALGYFSVDGVTDLSVVIRTIVVEGDQLSIGAGGAITWLSDRDGEWAEVLTKVGSVVGKLEGVE
ncbi:para-aminobenzoate synthetase [Kwoniella heveanensis CBS 569]|nr:para-aminobenzoate synthetase [Kwoniella heveanensis CBS 569]